MARKKVKSDLTKKYNKKEKQEDRKESEGSIGLGKIGQELREKFGLKDEDFERINQAIIDSDEC